MSFWNICHMPGSPPPYFTNHLPNTALMARHKHNVLSISYLLFYRGAHKENKLEKDNQTTWRRINISKQTTTKLLLDQFYMTNFLMGEFLVIWLCRPACRIKFEEKIPKSTSQNTTMKQWWGVQENPPPRAICYLPQPPSTHPPTSVCPVPLTHPQLASYLWLGTSQTFVKTWKWRGTCGSRTGQCHRESILPKGDTNLLFCSTLQHSMGIKTCLGM